MQAAWYERHGPAPAALFHHLFQVPVAQRIGRVPSGADRDGVDWNVHSFELEHVGSLSAGATGLSEHSAHCSMRQN
jgi:hypothetical protein